MVTQLAIEFKRNVLNSWREIMSTKSLRRTMMMFVLILVAFPLYVAVTSHQEHTASARVLLQGSVPCTSNINFGDTINCSLDFPSEVDSYQITANENDRILIRVSDMEFWLHPSIKISINGGAVTNCSSTHADTAQVECILPTTGNYTILISDGRDGTSTGSYYLYIQRLNAPGNSPEIAFGQTTNNAIRTPAQAGTYTFQAESGDRILARASDLEFRLHPTIELRNSDGQILDGCFNNHSVTAQFECVLPEDGPYRLLIYDGNNGTHTGEYHLYVQRLNLPGNSIPISDGPPASGNILSPAQVDAYQFPGIGDTRIQVTMSDEEFWFEPKIELRDMCGVLLNGCANTNPETAQFQCALPYDEPYTVLAYDGRDGTSTASYNLTLTCLDGSCVNDSIVHERVCPTPTPPTPTPTPPTPTPTPTPVSPTPTSRPKPLALIYAVLDNDLGDDPETWGRLVNNAEAGVHGGVNVRLFVDGPQAKDHEDGPDAYIYDLQADKNRLCPTLDNPKCGYQDGQTVRDGDEDSAHPDTLYGFIKQAIDEHPNAPTISLSLVGHGSGWSAGALPGQPSAWTGQSNSQPITITERVGGLLWDDAPGSGNGSRSLSTRALGYALDRVKRETGRTIDLLYLDACSMGMSEVAYELRDSVDYLLASPNTAWASFAYERMLSAMSNEQTGLQIGEAWIQAEVDALRRRADHPFTLVLIDTDQLGVVREQSDTLADALTAVTENERSLIAQSASSANRFESIYDGELDEQDTYLDLWSLAVELESHFTSNSSISSSASALRTGIENAVVSIEHLGGRPWLYPGREWEWHNLGGLAIYFPVASVDPRQALYNAENLQWAADGRWDDFLTTYWASMGIVAAAQSDLPTCTSTRDCIQLPEQLEILDTVLLPFVIH